jgi:hypothetical protein
MENPEVRETMNKVFNTNQSDAVINKQNREADRVVLAYTETPETYKSVK